VWIGGQRKLASRVLVDMDPESLVANARQWRDRIAAVRTA
jgi:5-methylthioadenosine/S-adenosylhomocysteine deaminase